MADFQNDRTVVVDRDTSSPLGWIALVVALLLVIMFFLTNGFGMMADDTDTTDTEAPTTSETQRNDTNPVEQTPTDSATDPVVTPEETVPAPTPDGN